ncbi:hypothetical protein AI27_00215 [Sphingomonas sp. BHC-A]|nr:hypothetical protein AI27_00215 [Sphingomonas sp. BHC-A]
MTDNIQRGEIQQDSEQLRELEKGGRKKQFDRAVARLCYVASETASRFVRERSSRDPFAWLMEPKELFDGQSAFEACRRPEGFRRAIAFHSLGLDHDADPRLLDDIPANAFFTDFGFSGSDDSRNGSLGANDDTMPACLFTGDICSVEATHTVQIFFAMIAPTFEEVRSRLRKRHGARLEDVANVRLGFDWSAPLANVLVSAATADMLVMVDANPTSALATGLDLHIEQRFAG